MAQCVASLGASTGYYGSKGVHCVDRGEGGCTCVVELRAAAVRQFGGLSLCDGCYCHTVRCDAAVRGDAALSAAGGFDRDGCVTASAASFDCSLCH